MSLVFSGWRAFTVFRDMARKRAYLNRMAVESERAFRRGIASSKSGRVYQRSGGRSHQASAPGEYPARDSGRHAATISSRVTANEMVVGSDMFYAKFLRDGTTKMAPRRMSQNALQDALARDRVGVGRFAVFRYV